MDPVFGPDQILNHYVSELSRYPHSPSWCCLGTFLPHIIIHARTFTVLIEKTKTQGKLKRIPADPLPITWTRWDCTDGRTYLPWQLLYC